VEALLREIAATLVVELPVNVMIMDGVPPVSRLCELGISRISYGPIPCIAAMSALKQHAEKVFP
jgi:2-methylisocitrate lyase-like PEP mutase family enzyme